MDCAKNGNSIDDQSASSPEQARENEIVVEASSSWERFYECTFCKRGFSNAQALGDHMSIHRKDRQWTGNDSKWVHSSFRSRPHSLASEPYSPLRETINCPSKYIENSFFEVQSSSPLGMNYDFMDASLSLRIGNGHEEVAEVIKSDGGHEEDGIDLELQLFPWMSSFCDVYRVLSLQPNLNGHE